MPTLSSFAPSRSVRSRVAQLIGVVACAAAIVLAAPQSSPAVLGDPPTPPAPTQAKVIVQLWDGNDAGPRAAVGVLGGTITSELPVVGGFAATIDGSQVAALAAHAGVRVVSADVPVLTQQAMPDGGAASVHNDVIGATTANAAGHRGAGVAVAVIDTGITKVAGLHGKVRNVATPAGGIAGCVNFSDEQGCSDNYGHGTFVGGLVHSVAADADLIAVKLSGRDGTSSVSRLLKAVGWVIDNKADYNIKVLNLSLRTYSPLSYRLDPVNLAVERAWAAGISVVVSAGNQGPGASSIAKPADDPWVITVGSTDDAGTVTLADDAVSSFSSRGPSMPDGVAKPDVVVPGRSLVSLRSPGSEADLRYPYFVDSARRRGSGTSFSAPLVAGAAAVLHAADASATNDRVKFALTSSGRVIPGASSAAAGAGVIELGAALNAGPGVANGGQFQPLFWPASTASSVDVDGSVFEPQWLGSNWQGSNWQGSNWQGSNWQGSNWQGSNWQGSNWQGSNWQGSNWQGSNWQGSNWQGSNWQGSNWQSSFWS